jgi:hypothetical protein
VDYTVQYMSLEVCWDGLWTLSFGLSQFHGHGSWFASLQRACVSVFGRGEETSLSENRGKPSENPKLRSPGEIDAANLCSLQNSAMGTRRLAASMCSRYFSSAATSAPASSSSSAAASGNPHLPQITLLCKQFRLHGLR